MTAKHHKNAKTIEDILKSTKNLEFESCSDVSEISDVFEEFHKNSYLKKQGKKYLSKHEADIRTMADFTEDFKRTIKKVREELKIKKFLEDIIEDFKNCQKSNPEIFLSHKYKKPTVEKVSVKFERDQSQSEESGESIKTGLWDLLEANSSGKFKLSPIGYNAFQQDKPHWSERPEINWETVEKSRQKCNNWLENYYFK